MTKLKSIGSQCHIWALRPDGTLSLCLLSCVNKHVLLQVTLVGTAVLAMRACVRLLARVSSNVGFEVPLPGETRWAQVAGEGPLPRVRAHVALHLAVMRGSERTDRTAKRLAGMAERGAERRHRMVGVENLRHHCRRPAWRAADPRQPDLPETRAKLLHKSPET